MGRFLALVAGRKVEPGELTRVDQVRYGFRLLRARAGTAVAVAYADGPDTQARHLIQGVRIT
jgi:hypothetical protein